MVAWQLLATILVVASLARNLLKMLLGSCLGLLSSCFSVLGGYYCMLFRVVARVLSGSLLRILDFGM